MLLQQLTRWKRRVKIGCGRAVGLDLFRLKPLHDQCLARRAYSGRFSRGIGKLQFFAMSFFHKLCRSTSMKAHSVSFKACL